MEEADRLVGQHARVGHQVLERHADEQPQMGEEGRAYGRQLGLRRVRRGLVGVGHPLAQRVVARRSRVPSSGLLRDGPRSPPSARARRSTSGWVAVRWAGGSLVPRSRLARLRGRHRPRRSRAVAGPCPARCSRSRARWTSAASPAPAPARSNIVTATGATIPLREPSGRRRRPWPARRLHTASRRSTAPPAGRPPAASASAPGRAARRPRRAAGRARTPPRRRCPRRPSRG